MLSPGFRSLPVSLLTAPAAELYRPVGENYDQKMRSARHLRAIARLKPGVTVSEAQSDMSVVSSHLTAQYPADDSDYSVRIVPMKEDLVGDLPPRAPNAFWRCRFRAPCRLLQRRQPPPRSRDRAPARNCAPLRVGRAAAAGCCNKCSPNPSFSRYWAE